MSGQVQLDELQSPREPSCESTCIHRLHTPPLALSPFALPWYNTRHPICTTLHACVHASSVNLSEGYMSYNSVLVPDHVAWRSHPLYLRSLADRLTGVYR